MKITLLEQMRMQRDQREGPEIQNLRFELSLAQSRYAESVRLRVQIEKVVSKEVFKLIMERIGCELADALLRELYEQVRKVAPAISEDYFFSLPPQVLMQLDSDSTFNQLLNQYKQQKYYPQVNFEIVPETYYRVMEVRIKIPELYYREVVEV